MRLLKFGHACVRLEKGDRALVIDPGGWSEPEALDDAAAVLITHEHPDHLDVDKLRAVSAPVFTNASVAEQLGDLGGRVTVVGADEDLEIAGFRVLTRGETHALIHPDIPRIANTGYLIDETVFHPGDSFTRPGDHVDTLLVPVYAPWLRLAEAIDFVRDAAPGRAMAIHDGMLNDNGFSVVDRLMGSMSGTDYVRLQTGAAVEC